MAHSILSSVPRCRPVAFCSRLFRSLTLAFVYCAVTAPPATAGLFVADTTGKVTSAPIIQTLGGRLFVQWDLMICGFAESLLGTPTDPLKATAEYRFTQIQTPSAIEFVTATIDFSGFGELMDPDGMGDKLVFDLDPGFTINVTLDLGLAPSYMLDTSFTAEQFISAEANADKMARPMKQGPRRDKAMTSDRVHAEAPGSGTDPTMHPVVWKITYGHSVLHNGVLQSDVSGGWMADSSGNKMASGFVNEADIMFTNPSPGRTQFTWMTSNTYELELNQNTEIFSFINTLDARLRVDCIGCVPEPSSLTLLGVGSVAMVCYGWRRRRGGTRCR